MIDDIQVRPSRLSGLWVCLVGGSLLALLLVLLDPVVRPEDCPNYGAGGNASAFGDPAWDVYLPLVVVGWLALVIVEQVLPVTWRDRSRVNGLVRATVAVTVALAASCWLVPSVLLVCR